MSSTILVVDDDEATRFAAERILKNNGYTVLTAESGVDAMPLLVEKKIDVLLTDLVMRETDGVDIMLELRKYRKNLPIIAMSAYGPKTAGNYLKIAKIFGAQATLEKPFTATQLLEAIAAALPAAAAQNPGSATPATVRDQL